MTKSQVSLTLKRGIGAFILMQIITIAAGFAFSYFFKLFPGTDSDSVDINIIGMLSVLTGGVIVLFLIYRDIVTKGDNFKAQIGLKKKTLTISDYGIVLAVLAITHLLAWVYRSVILPEFGYGDIIGSGTVMFTHIQENGSPLSMVGFLILALVVGPLMEELVFRGYLQSSLSNKFTPFVAILITSVLFMLGHGPMVLWPMYFLYSFAWGYVYHHTNTLKTAILIHVLSNLFYAIVAALGINLLA